MSRSVVTIQQPRNPFVKPLALPGSVTARGITPHSWVRTGGEFRARLPERMEARGLTQRWAWLTHVGFPKVLGTEPPLVMENHETPSLCPTVVGTWNL